jgi:hypothetical protein
MGLDQYAYAGIGDEKEELAYWRKHNRLHGWMQDLWIDKGKPNARQEESPMGDFNCIPVRLTLSDLEQLEAHIVDKKLPETGGFFFGHDSFDWDDENGKPFEDGEYHYKLTDLKFIQDARKAIEEGKEVYYDSWW